METYDNQFAPAPKKNLTPSTYGQPLINQSHVCFLFRLLPAPVGFPKCFCLRKNPLSVTGWSDGWSRRCNGRTWPNCTNCQERFSRWWFHFFLCSPLPGDMINIFQMGWNHQLVILNRNFILLFASLNSLHGERWTDILLVWAKSQHSSWTVMRQFFRWLS